MNHRVLSTIINMKYFHVKERAFLGPYYFPNNHQTNADKHLDILQLAYHKYNTQVLFPLEYQHGLYLLLPPSSCCSPESFIHVKNFTYSFRSCNLHRSYSLISLFSLWFLIMCTPISQSIKYSPKIIA